MFRAFHQRSYELEHLDKGDYTPEEYEGCLVELRWINEWLGDARALKHSLLAWIEHAGLSELSVLDVGAGSGELLRVIATEAHEHDWRVRLVGLELNERSTRAILEESRGVAEIAAVRGDAFHLPFARDAFDFVICSLFTHHFRDEDIVRVLREFARVTRRRHHVRMSGEELRRLFELRLDLREPEAA